MILLNTINEGTGFIIKEDPISYNGSVCMMYKYEAYHKGVMVKSDSMINIHDSITKAKEAINNAK